jgi:hypothetical protein
MKNVLLASVLALTMGCATAIMRPYVGDQQNWPTTDGSIVNVKYDIPIFNSLPPVPYDVVGELRVESPFYAQPEEHHMSTIIGKAKQFNAHALALVDGQLFFGPNHGQRDSSITASSGTRTLTTVNRFVPESFRPGVCVLAIRWLYGAPAGLPAKYAALAPVAKPGAKPPPPTPTVKPKTAPAKPATTKPVLTKPEPAKPAPTTNFGPSNSSAPTAAPAPRKKTAKPDEAR